MATPDQEGFFEDKQLYAHMQQVGEQLARLTERSNARFPVNPMPENYDSESTYNGAKPNLWDLGRVAFCLKSARAGSGFRSVDLELEFFDGKAAPAGPLRKVGETAVKHVLDDGEEKVLSQYGFEIFRHTGNSVVVRPLQASGDNDAAYGYISDQLANMRVIET